MSKEPTGEYLLDLLIALYADQCGVEVIYKTEKDTAA
jgi:hypothetical protein